MKNMPEDFIALHSIRCAFHNPIRLSGICRTGRRRKQAVLRGGEESRFLSSSTKNALLELLCSKKFEPDE